MGLSLTAMTDLGAEVWEKGLAASQVAAHPSHSFQWFGPMVTGDATGNVKIITGW